MLFIVPSIYMAVARTRTVAARAEEAVQGRAGRWSRTSKPAIHLCSHVGQAFRPACERDLQG